MQIHQVQFFLDKFLSLKQKISKKNIRTTPFSEKKPKIHPTTSEKKKNYYYYYDHLNLISFWPGRSKDLQKWTSKCVIIGSKISPDTTIIVGVDTSKKVPLFLVFFGATASFFLVVCLCGMVLDCGEQWALALNEARWAAFLTLSCGVSTALNIEARWTVGSKTSQEVRSFLRQFHPSSKHIAEEKKEANDNNNNNNNNNCTNKTYIRYNSG